MAVSTRTLLQLYTAVADLLALRESGTLTAATTTALTSAAWPFQTNRTDVSTKKYEGVEVYLEAAAANVTPNPNGVSVYAPSTGVFTPAVTYANAPGGTLAFDLFLRGCTRQWIIDAINETLRNIYYETRAPLTLVTDGDMETSGVGSWTASNATLSKVATAGNFEDGTQGLRVLATAATGYAQSATILVDPDLSPTWRVRVRVRADIGTARLIAYDVTNSANIDTVDWTSRGAGVINLQFALPTTCEALAFRLMGVANADDCYFDNCLAAPQSFSEFQLPEWVVSADQVRHVYWAPWETAETNRADQRQLTRLGGWRVLPDASNPIGMFTLDLGALTTGLLYVEALRPYSALTLDADTTFCPRELLELGASVKLLERLVTMAPSQNVMEWKKLLYGERSVDGVRNPGKRAEWIRMYRAMGPSVISRNVQRSV